MSPREFKDSGASFGSPKLTTTRVTSIRTSTTKIIQFQHRGNYFYLDISKINNKELRFTMSDMKRLANWILGEGDVKGAKIHRKSDKNE